MLPADYNEAIKPFTMELTMPNRYKNLIMAVLVILFGFGMSEIMKLLTSALNLNLTLSFIITLVLGLAIIYYVSKKLKLGEGSDDFPENNE